MNARDVIQTSLNATKNMVDMYLADLSDADLLVRPVPVANHIAWQLGHLISSEPQLVKMGLPDAAYLAIAVLVMAALAIRVGLRRAGPEADISGAALLAGAFTLLLSPHYAWYFTWLIPFACLVPSLALLWLTVTSFLLYLVPVGSQLVRGHERFVVESVLYVPFVALAAIDLWRYRRREPGSRPRHDQHAAD